MADEQPACLLCRGRVPLDELHCSPCLRALTALHNARPEQPNAATQQDLAQAIDEVRQFAHDQVGRIASRLGKLDQRLCMAEGALVSRHHNTLIARCLDRIDQLERQVRLLSKGGGAHG